MDYTYNLQIIPNLKKIDVHPLGPLKTLRENFCETGFYTYNLQIMPINSTEYTHNPWIMPIIHGLCP